MPFGILTGASEYNDEQPDVKPSTDICVMHVLGPWEAQKEWVGKSPTYTEA